MHSTPRRNSSILKLKALIRRIGLFWGIPGSMPISRMNDDRLYIRACAIAKRRYYILQNLLLCALWLPIILFWAISQNKIALAFVLFYLLPYVLIAVIAACLGEINSRFRLSVDTFTRREYRRLQALAHGREEKQMPFSCRLVCAGAGSGQRFRTDIFDRIIDRRANISQYCRNEEAYHAKLRR